jgi:hypothetical protein
VTFNDALDPATITVSSVKLLKPDGTTVGISPGWNATTKTITLSVQTSLDLSTQYTIDVEPTVKSLATGLPMAAPFTSRFTTTATAAPINIDAGATTGYTAPNGTVWGADAWWRNGTTRSTTLAIANTTDQKAYQTERTGLFQYGVPVPNGTWSITFKFAETLYTSGSCIGKRIFSLDIGNTPLLNDIANLDICSAAGGAKKAYDRTITGIVVTNNTLAVRATANVDNPEIAAIQATRTGP